MFSFLHAADLHLDSPLRGLERYPGAPADEIRGATRKALQALVELAVREQVAFVLIAGDIFDGDWKDYNTGDFFRRQMAILHDHAIPVITIRGNHDAASQITKSLRMPPNVKELATSRPETYGIDDYNVVIHGQGFAKRDILDDLSSRYPPPDRGQFNIGMLHTCAEGSPLHDPYAPCTVAGLQSREYDYWALGHIHQRRLLSSDPPILFPGNIQGRSVRECGPRGCSLVRVVDGRADEPVHVDLDVLRWHHELLDVSGCDTVDAVLTRAQETVTATAALSADLLLAVRLTLTGASRAHGFLERDPERISIELRNAMADASGGRTWLEKVEVSTRSAVDLKALVEADEAMAVLFDLINELKADDDACDSLGAEFRKLKSHLPRDAQTLESGLDLDDGRAVTAVLSDVEQILVSRFLDSEPAL